MGFRDKIIGVGVALGFASLVGLGIKKSIKDANEVEKFTKELERDRREQERNIEEERLRQEQERKMELLRQEREIERRKEEECKRGAFVFPAAISRLRFEEIVFLVANVVFKKRTLVVNIEGAFVYCRVNSQSGHSIWRFTIDFNDHGSLTGQYYLVSDNYDSPLPERMAIVIQSFIQDELKKANC